MAVRAETPQDRGERGERAGSGLSRSFGSARRFHSGEGALGNRLDRLTMTWNCRSPATTACPPLRSLSSRLSTWHARAVSRHLETSISVDGGATAVFSAPSCVRGYWSTVFQYYRGLDLSPRFLKQVYESSLARLARQDGLPALVGEGRPRSSYSTAILATHQARGSAVIANPRAVLQARPGSAWSQ